MIDGLRAVLARLEGEREMRFEIVYGQRLGVFEFEPLGSIRRDGRDLDGEGGIGIVFALLFEQSRIDGLQRQVLVDFFGAALFEDDTRDAYVTVPAGEARDRGGPRD